MFVRVCFSGFGDTIMIRTILVFVTFSCFFFLLCSVSTTQLDQLGALYQPTSTLTIESNQVVGATNIVSKYKVSTALFIAMDIVISYDNRLGFVDSDKQKKISIPMNEK